MKLFNRLCIFLLGFVMGIVGCVGGLAGGIYYAYTGLKVEDFTGVLTKDQSASLSISSPLPPSGLPEFPRRSGNG